MAKSRHGKAPKTDKADTADGVAAQAKYAGEVQSTSANVDYSLRRRTLLRDVRSGRVDVAEACDASPYLLSASRFHGEESTRRCPICRRENLWLVHYIFGEELRASAGQARNRAELAVLAREYRHIDVYVVEVCRGCAWNHVVEYFAVGRADAEAAITTNVTPLAARRSLTASHGLARDISRPRRTGITQR
ncbi:MAG TPA: DUF5318 family protein [Stackebrandtia sp.]|jgi:hypothetical protein|uniref:DUF5318 family protein n=1 Tax=Stackebrandtia sp. TaxID=2023065 RepID=UPI002D57024C|nr:DUF5318 family protein [Stackebrandtia sp.]HZE38873.1 DUF5318 family protein [Stackebrandtia sp.]